MHGIKRRHWPVIFTTLITDDLLRYSPLKIHLSSPVPIECDDLSGIGSASTHSENRQIPVPIYLYPDAGGQRGPIRSIPLSSLGWWAYENAEETKALVEFGKMNKTDIEFPGCLRAHIDWFQIWDHCFYLQGFFWHSGHFEICKYDIQGLQLHAIKTGETD